jgi:hypothetical protein
MTALGRPVAWFVEGWAVMPGLARSVPTNRRGNLPARHYWRDVEINAGVHEVISACGYYRDSWMVDSPPFSAPDCPRCKRCLEAVEMMAA